LRWQFYLYDERDFLSIFVGLCKVSKEMSELTRTKVKDLLKAAPGIEVLAKGWVRTKRGNKQIKFIALNDGSTVHNIQVVADMANFDESLIAKVTDRRQPRRQRQTRGVRR